MRYDNNRAFEKHLEASAPSHFSHLYLILNKEPGELREPAERVVSALFPDIEERSLALRIMDGSSLILETLVSELNSASFFVKKQAFWLQNIEKCKKPILDFLENFFSNIPPSQFIIITAAAWNKQTKLYKAAEKEGVIFETAELKPWEKEKNLIEWVNKELIAARKVVSYQTVQEFVKQTGLDKALLASEMEKLLCYVGEKREITFQDFAKICTLHAAESIWQLGEAIFRRDAAAAIPMACALLKEGQPLLPLLRQIRSQFQTQFHIGMLLEHGKSAQDVANEFPYMKGAILTRTLQQVKFYGIEAFRKGLLSIDEFEMRAKNSQGDETLLLELLMIKLSKAHV